MTAKSALFTGVVATTLALSAQSLFACAVCGCSAKKADKSAASGACSTGACALSTAPKAHSHANGHAHAHNINTFQLKEYVEAGSAILLDARSGQYDDGLRIPGAKSLNSKSTAAEIAAVIPSKDALVVTYCSNLQCPASKMLAEHLIKLGYTNVKEYPEGIAGWRAAGGEVVKVK